MTEHLDWCDKCPRFGVTCTGTEYPVFCPKVELDEEDQGYL